VIPHINIPIVVILFGLFRQFWTQKNFPLPSTVICAIPKFSDKNLDSMFHTHTV